MPWYVNDVFRGAGRGAAACMSGTFSSVISSNPPSSVCFTVTKKGIEAQSIL